jgi:hypothetical protein
MGAMNWYPHPFPGTRILQCAAGPRTPARVIHDGTGNSQLIRLQAPNQYYPAAPSGSPDVDIENGLLKLREAILVVLIGF